VRSIRCFSGALGAKKTAPFAYFASSLNVNAPKPSMAQSHSGMYGGYGGGRGGYGDRYGDRYDDRGGKCHQDVANALFGAAPSRLSVHATFTSSLVSFRHSLL